jgi:(p)ppGpp synthase/HD superfamily hydrolase
MKSNNQSNSGNSGMAESILYGMSRTPVSQMSVADADKAAMFCVGIASAAHRKQKRKYTNEPYIEHPMRVFLILGEAGEESVPIMLASILHDVLEDTDITEQEMRDLVGDEVTDLVLEVTDTSKPEDGNRAERKAIDRDHLAKSTYGGATIKLADLIDNSRDIVEGDHQFAQVYLEEKAELLPVLSHGNPVLFAKAKQQLADCLAELTLREGAA